MRRGPTEQTMAAYVGSADPANWRSSPLLASFHSDLHPALIVVLDVDPLHDEALLYAEKLKGAGVTAHVMLFDYTDL
ncbi:alpha/beta hydrolase fold domain-containing protein [Sphingobium sp. AN558]|uniref:alpha/beta hydrolase fold domain-containing protein n=1 Tax=Sphingobium sp. AN558 TaxID=3133442 RepID=UPI0030C17960